MQAITAGFSGKKMLEFIGSATAFNLLQNAIGYCHKKLTYMDQVPTFQINTLDDQKKGFAVTLWLAKKLEDTRLLFNVREMEFNFYGDTHLYQIPQKDYRHSIKNSLGMTVFEILVFDGANPYNYIFHFFGDKYYFDEILREVEKYKKIFYIENIDREILIPKFF